MRSAVPLHSVSCWFTPMLIKRLRYCFVFFYQTYSHVIGDIGVMSCSGDGNTLLLVASTRDPSRRSNAKDLGPPDTVSEDNDDMIAGMVNFLFDKSMQEEDYKAISEDMITTRPNNCPTLAEAEAEAEGLQVWPTAIPGSSGPRLKKRQYKPRR
ncbi:hypothetical protein E2C01_040435 [Portunus trituberculatus]|uniref:Uncharacterized protein n=1 Tax=Portunus trituberculatus TaxID=210409 RepID=A0A5B7FNA8_PORTR|nr:hypothetical protein [Portunus trituberculatus]